MHHPLTKQVVLLLAINLGITIPLVHLIHGDNFRLTIAIGCRESGIVHECTGSSKATHTLKPRGEYTHLVFC